MAMSLRGRGLLIVVATLCAIAAMIPSTVATASASPISYVQGTAFDNSSGGSTLTVSLSQPVGSGNLLVGWFAQYGATGDVKVSDNVNGAWTRGPQSTQFGSSGDIAMYYVQGSEAASTGITITVSAASGADFQGAVADYSGVATVGALSMMAVNRGSTSAISAGPTSSIASGDLVFAAEVTGVSPDAVPTPGSDDGLVFTERASTTQGSAFDEDITSSAAGAQTGTATLAKATDWYAVVAIFLPSSGPTGQPPTVPTGLNATSVTSSSVDLSWNAATDSTGTLAGYTVYRNGTEIATTPAGTTTYDDTTVSPSTTYSYTVDAYDTSGNHSAQSTPALSVTTPAPTGAASIKWVQGASVSTGSLVTSTTLQLTQPVGAGDLLVGWFGQYSASGQVKVSDTVNGVWTRTGASTTFSNGGGDLAMFYVQNAAASSGLTVTISAASATYLQGAVSEFSGIATTGALDQVAAARSDSSTVDSGPTSAVAAGDLVVGGIVTGGDPGTVTPGSTQGQTFTMGTQTNSGSSNLEYVLSSAAGTQDARATFSSVTDWYSGVATFHPATSSGPTGQPPTVPTGLNATSVTSSSVDLSWNAATDSTGTLAGYTVYRNGTEIATTPAGTTTYDDTTVSPSTTYSYTVDAYDTSGNHSAQSTPALSVTTPAPTGAASIKWVQGASVSTGSLVTSTTLQLTQPVGAGDLLVGWFGQYSASGQVKVSDTVNGVWTRGSASTTFGSKGDLAFYYAADTKAASSLTITISAASATYLQAAVSEFSGVATSGALQQATATNGNSTAVNSGPTASVGAGDLVIGGIVTGGQPGSVTPGSSEGDAFTMGTETNSGTADLEYILASASGTQSATATFSSSTDWYAGVSVFSPATAPAAPSVPTGLSDTSDTSSSVGLSWTAAAGASGYTVYRDGTDIGTTATTAYTDSTVSPSTTYSYTVASYNSAGTASAQSQPALSVTTPAATTITKVLVIMDENESDIDVFPSASNSTAAMPYLWSLAQEYGYATDWSDVTHPSQANYFAIFAGSLEGDPDDCAPGPGCTWSGPTVFSQAIAAGGTAKAYEEGMASNCTTSNTSVASQVEGGVTGYYDYSHNPWLYFSDASDAAECAADDVPSGTPTSGSLYSDITNGTLPTIGTLKPDLQNDTTDGTFATADNWLKSWIPVIQSGPDWQSGHLAVVITFDESDEGAGGENVPFVLIAPGENGVVVNTALNHYALTRFLDEVAGVSLLGNADTQPDIAPLFGVNVSG
jgi:chitodextrinase